MSEYEYRIASVTKAFLIIELMSRKNGELSVTQIAEELDSSKSSINRFLITLQEIGYVDKNEHSNKYYLTNKFFFISNSLLYQNALVEKYMSIANYISQKYNVSVNINTMFENKPILLYKTAKFYSKDIDFNLGDTIPAYCSGAGKMIMSAYTEKELNDYFKDLIIIKYQSNTLASEDEIRNELKKIAKNGFAIHNQEYIAGIFSISFPLYINSKLTGAMTLITEMKNRNTVYNTEVVDEIKNKLKSVK